MNRAGTVLLWVGGAVIALLMAYTLALDTTNPLDPTGAPDDADLSVAVFYPDRILWQEFLQGVRVCTNKKLAAYVGEDDASVVLRLPQTGRRLRFVWDDVRGLRETGEKVRRLLGRAPSPVAFVGSSNTVLTEAIANAVRDLPASSKAPQPVILIPWASAVLSEREGPGEGPVSLLDLLPGRMFRFCPNNQYLADLLVAAVLHHDEGRTPARIVLVEDRHDPYSTDLAMSFHRAADRAAPRAEIVERADALSFPMPADPMALPTPAEEALAESIWRDAEALPEGSITWVLLPLQDDPARRVLYALRRQAHRPSTGGEGPLRVICGDAFGRDTMAQLAGRCPFPIWCASAASARAAAGEIGHGISPDNQVPAEIVAALIACLDRSEIRPAEPDALRDALAALRIAPDDQAAMGRSLTFRRSGEREGEDLGHVLATVPGRSGVFSLTRSPSGAWAEQTAPPPSGVGPPP